MAAQKKRTFGHDRSSLLLVLKQKPVLVIMKAAACNIENRHSFGHMEAAYFFYRNKENFGHKGANIKVLKLKETIWVMMEAVYF